MSSTLKSSESGLDHQINGLFQQYPDLDETALAVLALVAVDAR